MKKALLSIVKFFGLALVFLAFLLAVNANKRGFNKLADSSKAGSSRFTASSIKKAGSAYKYKASEFGNALNFDGGDDYVTMGAGLILPESGWTEEMWIYLPEVSSPDVKTKGMIVIGNDDMTIFSKRGPFFFVLGSNTLHGGYGYGIGQTQRTFDARNALTVNAWNHIAQTYDGRRLKAYINGKIVVDEEAPEKPNANPIKYLGGRDVFNYYYDFKGSIDELRIWNRARSAEEIENNYEKTVAPDDPDLLLYYSFNQGIAGGDNRGIRFVKDSKGGFHGALHNFALNGSSSNFVASLAVETTASAATNITHGSFTANWAAPAVRAVDKYCLEVARDDKFTNLVSGYENVEVPGNLTSQAVSGLSPDVTYYYRVKAVAGGVTGPVSNIISVKTLALREFGNALNFDGWDDYVTMGAGFTLPESGWTEEMWIYLPEVSSDKLGMLLIGSDDMTNSSKRGPFLFVDDGNTLYGGYGYGTGQTQRTFDAYNVLTVNAWNHIAQTYDGRRLKAYINGKIVVDEEAPDKPNANPIKYLGGGVFDHYYHFQGSIDELRIWNRARSAEEIKNNYAKTVAPDDPDLLLYYSFDQGIAGGDNTGISFVKDSKGGFHGALHNFALKGSSSNFVASLVFVKTTANEATNITEGSFTANWAVPAGTVVDKYRLEVARDDKFTRYENVEVPGNLTSIEVSGLSHDVTYYYRIKVVAGGVTGLGSNIISVKTHASSGFGNALNFDGRDDFITIGSELTLPESGWTEEMWIYLPEVSPEVKTKGMMVISNDDMTVFSKRGPFLQIFNGNILHGGYGTENNQRTYYARNALTVNAWNHIAQTYDGRRLKAYINGKMVVDEEAPEKPNANPIKYLGQGFFNHYYHFQGSIDELRIWNRARSAEEIKKNYDQTVALDDPDLLLYYSFNQGIAGGDNTDVSSVRDSKEKFAGVFNNFALDGSSSNFVASLVKTKANAATNITEGSFTANWAAPAGRAVDKYRLEVSRDDKFTRLVPGYENVEIPAGSTSWAVNGLSPDFTYYYRVKAVAGGVTGPNSNAISAKTQNALKLAGNIITPNGDGVNDVWIIENIEQYPDATVKVFDKARRLVFSQTNYDNKWNGYYNGRPLRQGAYYYVISIGEGKNIISKGYITIINEQ